MNAEDFFAIKKKYGQHASFAVWSSPESKTKEMVGDLGVFEHESISSTLAQIHTRYILIGLNVSRALVSRPFANFHDGSRFSQDYKLRYALNGSALWGAYITDIFKDVEEVDSVKIMKFMNGNREVVDHHIKNLQREIADVSPHESTKIVAIGAASYTVLKKYFSASHEVLRIRHYAHRMQLESYREEMRIFK